ncbi:MAG: phage tail sheath family protein [Cyclobacteriaceae bacterium]|nr:phage tail sheath family protein [Cyclobacteriaceae bacterium]
MEAVEDYLTTIKRANETDGSFDDSVAITDMPSSLKEKFLVYKKAVDASTDAVMAQTATRALFSFCRHAISGFQDVYDDLDPNTSQLAKDINTYAKANSMWRGAVVGIVALDKNDKVRELNNLPNPNISLTALYDLYDDNDGDDLSVDWVGSALSAITPVPASNYAGSTSNDSEAPLIAKQVANDVLGEFEKLIAYANAVTSAADSYLNAAQNLLYEKHSVIGNIVKNIRKKINTLPPSGGIAGIYAKVDNSRGVWKAPANVSMNSVSAPSVFISHDEQANINVDAVAGKSINAIRSFTGKGTVVWGARTLSGNDNEWRYISVRRFFNMVEESCKKSTEPFVFEPNDSSTWIKVQTMIENFLTNLWRQGALQGAKPEHAFYVAVGLGKTMTSVDILEGRMIVEIGMAVVRPAEFIILQFSHKMAES